MANNYVNVRGVLFPIVQSFIKKTVKTELFERILFSTPQYPNSFAFSPDSRFLALSYNKTPFIEIFDMNNGELLRLDDPASLPTVGGGQVIFSPNGNFLAIGHGSSPYLTIYDMSTGIPIKLNISTLPKGYNNEISFSPDSRFLAMFHGTTPFITIYDMSSGAPIKLSNPASLPITDGYQGRFSPDGNLLALVHDVSPYLTVYDMSSGVPVKIPYSPHSYQSRTRVFAFSPDSKRLITGQISTPCVMVFDISSESITKRSDLKTLPNSARSIKFSPDGSLLMIKNSGYTDSRIYFYSPTMYGYDFERSFSLPTEGEFDVSIDNYLSVAFQDPPYFSIYNMSDGEPVITEYPKDAPSNRCYSVLFSPDGKYLVCKQSSSPYTYVYKANTIAEDRA